MNRPGCEALKPLSRALAFNRLSIATFFTHGAHSTLPASGVCMAPAPALPEGARIASPRSNTCSFNRFAICGEYGPGRISCQ